ncbi:MAG: trigger factor [Fimbriimonadaceae bacterium]|nr:trigger factor [Fimbriimonadaceae bacterium]
MTVTREDLNPCTVRLTIVPSPEQVKSSFDRAFREMTKDARVAGFRPGKAPRAMLEKMIHEEQWMEEAARVLVNTTLQKAIESEQLSPDANTSPSVEVKSINRAELAAEYSAKVPLPPKVELADPKLLSITLNLVEVTDEEIDQQIEQFRKGQGKREAVTDRGIADGDVAVLDIRAEGDSEGKRAMVIAGKTFAELDALIAGMHLEEIKSGELTFPADWSEIAWRGQTLSVTVAVQSLTAVALPSIDDDFAKALQTENLDDLRTRIREGLMQVKEDAEFEMATDKLLDEMVAKSTIEVSDNMWEQLADRRLRETAEAQAQQGKSLEQYTAELGMTIEQFVASWNERAQAEIKRAFVIQNLFAANKMQLSNEEMSEELFRMAQENNVTADALYAYMQKNNDFQELNFRAIQRKVRTFLLSQADRKEAGVAAETEAPESRRAARAKKSAAAPDAVAPDAADAE